MVILTISYAMHKNLTFTVYGDNFFVLGQNIIILFLFALFSTTKKSIMIPWYCLTLALGILFIGKLLPSFIMDLSMHFQIAACMSDLK